MKKYFTTVHVMLEKRVAVEVEDDVVPFDAEIKALKENINAHDMTGFVARETYCYDTEEVK